MKPVEMFAQLLQDGSKKGATVYEPFLGSGTTLIAAEQTGRTSSTPAKCPVCESTNSEAVTD